MTQKPTYKELEQMIKELEEESVKRKKAEEALRESEEFSSSLLNNSPNPILVINPDTSVKYVNPALEELIGFSSAELIGRKAPYPWWTEETLQKTSKDLEEAMRTGARRIEQLFKKKNRKQFWAEITSEPVKKNGEFIYYLANWVDITDRKRAEEALQESMHKMEISMDQAVIYAKELNEEITERKQAEEALQKYERIVSAAQEHMLFIDKNYIYQAANDAYLVAHNKKREEIIGHSVPELLGTKVFEEQVKVKADQCLAGEEIHYQSWFEFSALGKRYMDVAYYPYVNNDGLVSGMVVCSRDITEQKQLESKLLQSQKMEAIGTLAGGIAHDFNNILLPIVGYADMALFSLPKDNSAIKYLEGIHKSSMRARDLVQQILTFSSRHSEERMPLNVQSIINEAIKFLRATIPSTIEINQNIDNDCGSVMGNPTQIHQILMNLCTNAYHSMEDKGGKLEVSLSNVLLDAQSVASYPGLNPGNYVKLTVSDTGIGMEKDVKERIFEPYFTTKEVGKGTGMGLSVVHGIVATHGGYITVYSEPEKGTTFNVYLPHVETATMEPKPVSTEPVEMGDENILLVDDEEMNILVMQEMLEQLGYKVTARNSSVDAIEVFRVLYDKFDLVITDMTMPNMTGDQLAKELINIRPGIPIILLSGFSEKMSQEKAKAIGIREFIMKPVVFKDLANTIRKVLDQE